MTKDPVDSALEKQLDYLKLSYCKENFRPLAAEGNAKHWTHLDYLQRLIEGEVATRQDRTLLLHRLRSARLRRVLGQPRASAGGREQGEIPVAEVSQVCAGISADLSAGELERLQ